MERRGGNDSSNFFNRIKNVDVLRSPFPRHLAQPSRQPAMASSTRPAISGYSTAQQTARPTPLAAPSWQTPVPRPGSFNVSPLGSYKRADAPARVPASPAFYRPPAEYPSSVQPIRVRPYPVNDYRQIPGSTLPAHIASGLSSRNLQPGTLCCILRNWFVCIDMDKLTVTVSGSYMKPNGIAVARHSSPIDIAIERRTIVATSGTMYQLVDAPDLEMMRMKGMPEYLVSQFADGFPRNWKQLVEEYFGISSEARRGRSDLTLRGEEAARIPANGHLNQDYRSGLSMGNRFQPIAENSEALASISPISPPSSVSIGGYNGTRQQRSPSVTVAGTKGSRRTSVYRSGADIFATDRFSRANPAQQSEAFESEHQKQPAASEAAGMRAETLSPVADDQTRSSSEVATETPLERTPMARADTDLQNQVAAISMETPTKKPEHSPSLSPELGGTQISSWKDSQTNSTMDDPDPFKLDDDFESPEPDQTNDEIRMASPELKSNPKVTTPTAKPASKQRTRRLSRKIIESSDELPAAAEDTGEESKSSAQELAEDSDESSIKPTASTAKRIHRKTPASANSRLARRTPKSARTERAAKSDRAARKSYAGLARSIHITPTKPSKKAAKQIDDVEVVIKKRPSKPRLTRSSQQLRADSNAAAGSESDALPLVKSSSDGKLEVTKKPKKSKAAASKASPAQQSQPKAPETPKPTTPKRKLDKQASDSTPEAPASVTRSGRKVRKPQEWWANAQEHLGTTYKGSDIKYHWGKGDAIIIRDGKRYRLSDVVLDGDNAEPLSSSHKSETDEVPSENSEHGK